MKEKSEKIPTSGIIGLAIIGMFLLGIFLGIMAGILMVDVNQECTESQSQQQIIEKLDLLSQCNIIRPVDCGPTECVGVWSGATEIVPCDLLIKDK